ncbi:PREDICTED: F-box protein At3g62230 [Populus euphratica]|uniref:F-box protein At3g62230 n=1 Tax=Populus euphratica TaxID=75702 RepID=A0AAJ6X8J4_POPEU|nr:PREDICTED: F-box protein At3g62230 [Populus euphratica]
MDRNTDMFSNLPSSLLIIIASFLSFKEAARTCILSKKWLNIWREVENVDFDENNFVKLDESEKNQKVQREVFINFARQFIANHSQQVIKTLGLRCSKPGNFLVDMQNIVKFATSHNATGLRLDFSDPTWREDAIMNHEAVFELPSHVYEHGQALESLKLFSCRFDASKFTNFSAIKSLSLGWININIGSILVILESCPLLETLRLKKCWNLEYFEVSKPGLRLQNLVLDKCDFRHEWLLIEGPRFQFFKYSGKVGQFLLENQRDMVEAELDFGMQTEFEEVGALLYDLLQELFAARILTVCSVFLQIIPSGDEPLGLQAPLEVRNLILKTALHSNEYCGIKFMLRSCPRLETLTIDIGPARIFPDYEPPYPFDPEKLWSRNFQVEFCVSGTLRVVNVKGFKGTRNELYVLRYLLHFGRAMEELNLYASNEDGDNGENREFYMGRAQIVLGFYKASRNVSISVL